MELFTLGEGHYGERDIKEAARAFTGWSIDRQSGSFRFYRLLHDGGEKAVLGQTGRFDGDDVLDILLAHPATAEFLTRKLWREFVSPDPDAAEVKRLAGVLRESRYAIRPWLRAMLLSPAFWQAAHRGVLVKSPVEFLLGLVESLDVEGVDPRVLALASRQLGQDLFAPPGGNWWNDCSVRTKRRSRYAWPRPPAKRCRSAATRAAWTHSASTPHACSTGWGATKRRRAPASFS